MVYGLRIVWSGDLLGHLVEETLHPCEIVETAEAREHLERVASSLAFVRSNRKKQSKLSIKLFHSAATSPAVSILKAVSMASQEPKKSVRFSPETKNAPGDPIPSKPEKPNNRWKKLLLGTSEPLRKYSFKTHPILIIISTLLRGVAQVVFMDSPITGLFIFTSLFAYNPFTTLLGLLGGLSNLFFAVFYLGPHHLFKTSAPNYLNNGIFVYNGFLTGQCIGVFLNNTPISNFDFYWSMDHFYTFLKCIPCVIIVVYTTTSIHVFKTSPLFFPAFRKNADKKQLKNKKKVGMTNVFANYPVFTFPFNLSCFICWFGVAYHLPWIDTTLSPSLPSDTSHLNDVYPNFYKNTSQISPIV